VRTDEEGSSTCRLVHSLTRCMAPRAFMPAQGTGRDDAGGRKERKDRQAEGFHNSESPAEVRDQAAAAAAGAYILNDEPEPVACHGQPVPKADAADEDAVDQAQCGCGCGSDPDPA